MLKYISIPLSSGSDSFCHYNSTRSNEESFISEETLEKVVFWAMRENLSIQFVYPRAAVPRKLEPVIESIDHIKIVPEAACDKALLDKADIIIAENFNIPTKIPGKIYVVRTDLAGLLASAHVLKKLMDFSKKVNVVFTDTESFSKEDIDSYREFLNGMADHIASEYIGGNGPQLNLITDRLLLTEMNNCNAGDETIAVSPEGEFYPCPAFIGEPLFACGNIDEGLRIPNQSLYKRENAPICKVCDAYHCKRCAWLNHRLTHETNTPGWQQCYMSHIERSASARALEAINAANPEILKDAGIPHIDYLDPFTIVERL